LISALDLPSILHCPTAGVRGLVGGPTHETEKLSRLNSLKKSPVLPNSLQALLGKLVPIKPLIERKKTAALTPEFIHNISLGN